MTAKMQIYRLKVRLLRISPMIWRRVQVPSDITLRELHGVLGLAVVTCKHNRLGLQSS